jgi:hypothetical protein
MPQFSDDLFLGSAQSFAGINTTSNLGDPAPMDLGFGPMGRSYIYDILPQAVSLVSVLAAQTPSVATTYSGTQLAAASAAAGTTRVIRSDGQTVVQLDYPRAVSLRVGAGSPTASNVTITGYDYYGQSMTEIIQTGTTQNTTVNGRKAFFQVYSVAFSAATTVSVSVGTTKIFGLPAKITDLTYIIGVNTNNTLARDTGTALQGLGGGNTFYSTQVTSSFTAATPGVMTVAYSPPSGTLVQLTGSLGTLTGVALNTTYVWTNASATTGSLSTTQTNYLAGTLMATGGTTITSGMNLVTIGTSAATTPDVRGTYAPSTTPDGTQRLVVTLGMTGIQVGPNATRAGLLGFDQA